MSKECKKETESTFLVSPFRRDDISLSLHFSYTFYNVVNFLDILMKIMIILMDTINLTIK